MSAQIIQLNAYRRAGPQEKPRRIRVRRKRSEVDPSFFALNPGARPKEHCRDFMRGRRLAELAIEQRDTCALQRTFEVLLREAMGRAVKGGKRSRTTWTPASYGFLEGLAYFLATGARRFERSPRNG
jgi:hypothetical protein